MKKIVADNDLNLSLQEVPSPEVHDNEVAIKIEAIGVNFADIKILNGNTLDKGTEMGSEIAGIVESAGRDAHRFKPGDRVFAATHWGGCYAEKAVVPEFSVRKLPEYLSFEQGAAFAVTTQTAYHAVITTGKIQAGEWVLILAAGGGVGTQALQIAKLRGAKVIAAASSAEKLERLKAFHPDVLVNYAEEDLQKAVMDATNGDGVNCVLDGNGGADFAKNFKMMANFGRVVLYGNAAGPIPPIDPYSLIWNAHQIIACTMRVVVAQPELFERAYNDIFEWLKTGQLKVEIGHVLPLSDAAKAHELMLGRKNYGKIVLKP
ncbi:Alcohol dehydrogenase zinc-binding domain protein [Chloroherpeton thalassium ATCC 35110]|uniref:Alcohol dehydrogenase zinc-binding domain protein n=1 Tax=Chloroherpeton thalassium (strain ATCC 35110 / GB-78) TaxID=517418 RepID=B3QTZ3_CHLT3|nr:NADPH:quinone oxidoreductase family protein [Chloroherpeton thalassium]ACF12791.1 Alcohol dehydrogenase zinc-binding domain protein [Chloroherpeton thalassium ATCC 35110]